ncbi:hypothetical protein CCACVL1_20627 [Corchorus capsularis]|uniref:Uncharacterized protein n=1 Tax=Corchorus capsularis TaxID=210143 RepID=A0A1R3HAD1_COCAP|nr:hypothetical protein CCACVL1_20627 [Corchorus capsularis]
MAIPPSITEIFARLASHLQLSSSQREDEEESLNLAISKLNQSLNLDESPDSGVRVLDTALSLMCYKSPQVYDSVIEYSVKTIVSILSSSVNCKVLRLQNEEFMLVGVFPRLQHAVVRVAVLASCYQYSYPLVVPIFDVKSREERSPAVSKLHSHLPTDLSLGNEELPLRLMFWYLDPLTLKQAVSKLLQDTMGRPFLCLTEEFHQRMDWRAIIICLGLSPLMFIEIRALLHSWFLKTGLDMVLELLVGLVSAILDIISRPTWWGISMEMGSKVPFSFAYFPNKNHLLRILAGPFTAENFLRLVHATSEEVHPTVKPKGLEVSSVDHKSLWALAIDFPDWFYFSSYLLFYEKSLQNSFQSNCTLVAPKVGETHDKESLSASAASYIAWILSPINKSNQDLIVEFLTKISESWTLKQFDSVMYYNGAGACKKKLKKPKLHDKKEDYAPAEEYDCQKIGIWVTEFENICLHYAEKIVKSCASAASNASHGSLQRNVFLRRIPLGILIGYPSSITEDGFELLLHYAATGRILQETRRAGSRYVKQKSDRQDLTAWVNHCSKRDVLAGASAVFNLTDAVDHISASLFETEEGGLDFICQVKAKAGNYLMKCVKRLCQVNIEKDEVLNLRDLCSRLRRWMHQGQEILQLKQDIDDFINDLSQKLSSLEGDCVKD